MLSLQQNMNYDISESVSQRGSGEETPENRRIYEILEAKGMTQKDLAKRLGKTETEVSRWLSGTHNLTLSTICKISAALGDPILKVVHQKDKNHAFECEPMMASEPLSAPEP